MNQSTDAAEAFKHSDATSYDAVVDDFARFTVRFSQPIAERISDLASLKATDHVLDVGTGTGVVALEAALRLGVIGRVDAIDLSAGMLATAERLAALESAGKGIEWRSMDAEALAFQDAHVDVVMSLFALLHFPNPLAALCEMRC